MPVLPAALRKRCLVAATALSLITPQLAFAQDDTATEKAREMFQDGVAIEVGGDYASALKKFRAVAAVKKTPQVLYHIAVCLEQLGQLAEALDNYKQASVLAGKDARFAEVKLTVDNATTALDERVPTLVIKRGKGARSATILLDGTKLEPDATTEPFRLDPGMHVVQARAKGKDNFKAEFSLNKGAHEELRIEMRDLDDGADDDESADEPSAPAASSKGGYGPMPYVFGGIGLAGLAASGVFFAMRSSANNELQDKCIELTCPVSAHSTWERARSMNSLTNISAGVGIAALTLSAGMFIFGGGPSKEPPKTATTAPRIRLEASTSTPFGAQLAGSFLPRAPRARRDAHPLGRPRCGLQL